MPIFLIQFHAFSPNLIIKYFSCKPIGKLNNKLLMFNNSFILVQDFALLKSPFLK